jgi:hypothetical protein
MGWDLGVGVERKAVDTGAARTRECGTFPFIPKARANPAHVLSGPLPKGDALLDRGGHGARELGLVVAQGIIACSHGGVDARLQVSPLTERADDPPTDLLENLGNVRIAGRLDLDKARLEALVSPIEIGSLKEDNVIMNIGVRRRLYLIV